MKMTPSTPTPTDYVHALNGNISEVESPNQPAMNEYWNMISSSNQAIAAPIPVSYNFQTTQISKAQKFLIIFAAAGVAYLIFKQIKRG